jgi:hypothetical protein
MFNEAKIFYRATPHQEWMAHMWGKGFASHGVQYTTQFHEPRGDYNSLLVVWGEKHRIQYGNRFKHVLVNERAYFQDRFKFVSCGYNGLNGHADFLNKDMPPDRFNKHFNDGRLKPWNPKGEYILLALQIPGDNSLNGVKYSYPEIISQLNKRGFTVKVRQHPSRPNKMNLSGVEFLPHEQPIEEQLEKCQAVVAVSSNVSVDAMVAGKPVLNFSDYSMVWDMALKSYDELLEEQPEPENRMQWCYDLAYTQWLPEEIESGEAWEHLKKFYD